MDQVNRFRRMLPITQTVIAAFFGGWGLWQRNEILSRSLFGWNSTAQFHVWPWPFKFAAVLNAPAFLAGLLLSWPISSVWPELPETVQLLPSLVLIPGLWYWIGSWLDRRQNVTGQNRWAVKTSAILLLLFALASAIVASIPIGYVSYLPLGTLLWVFTAFGFRYMSKVYPGSSSSSGQ